MTSPNDFLLDGPNDFKATTNGREFLIRGRDWTDAAAKFMQKFGFWPSLGNLEAIETSDA